MTQHAPQSLFAIPALERAVPRYTSYPTQPYFSEAVGADSYARWLSEIRPDRALNLYLHIPFCRQICWFCACRTQALGRAAILRRYVDGLVTEAGRVGALLTAPLPVTRISLGGGSPTVLEPADLERLMNALAAAFPGAADAVLHAEIDPRDMSEERCAAFAAAGLGEVSLGVQDIDPAVQAVIGRGQDHATTCRAVERLRANGVSRVTLDLLYGLPDQTIDRLTRSVEAVVALAPERVALYGYAHVPWMAKRQTMIDARRLPGLAMRRAQADHARGLLIGAGYVQLGLDHFVRPEDPLAVAQRDGRIERCFEGYQIADGSVLIGLGASAVGALPQGYVQNEATTARYLSDVLAGRLTTRRGHALSLEDRVRRAAINQILCAGALDLDGLTRSFGDFAKAVADRASALVNNAPDGALLAWRGGFTIAPLWRTHTRLLAAEFDTYLARGAARHSMVI